MIEAVITNNLIPAIDYIYGFADLDGLLSGKFSGYRYGISIGRKLDDNVIDKLADGPTLEYYHYYNTINRELAETTSRICHDLLAAGIESLAVEPTIKLGSPQYEKYLSSLSYDISHKMVATRAGLGWIGKTDLFISKEFGPRLRLVTILLNLDPGINSVPVIKSRCGKCNICVEKCPAGAANGKLWNTGIHRDEFFDAHKCREKCGELAKQKLNVDERICGLCIYVCPIGNKAQQQL
jgi:epoxyqueuosine reductase